MIAQSAEPTIRQSAMLPGDYPDPSIVRVGGDYYLVHSSFNYAPGLLLWHSTNLKNWRPVARALPNFDGEVWAPDIVHFSGRFFIYYKTTGGNRVICSDKVEGPWSEPLGLDVGYIDPGHVVGSDGRRFLHLSDGMVAALADDGLSVAVAPTKVYDGWPIPEEWRIEGFCLEGPKLTWRDNKCYLLSAQGGTAGPATSHMVVVARSNSATGPWENSPYNPLVHTESREDKWWSRGHGSLVSTPEGRWFIIYHAYERGYHALGRQTLIEPIEWTEDGWPKIAFDSGEQDARDQGEFHQSMSDDFAGPELGWQWGFFGEHRKDRYRFDGNSFVLRATGSTPAESSPMCCVPRDHAYEADVFVRLNEPSTEAGLSLFYNAAANVTLSLKNDGVYLSSQFGPYKVYETDRSRMGLRIRNDRHQVEFWLSDETEHWRRLTNTYEMSGYHHNVFGGFTSLRVGLFATGTGSATFSRFRYQPIQRASESGD